MFLENQNTKNCVDVNLYIVWKGGPIEEGLKSALILYLMLVFQYKNPDVQWQVYQVGVC